MQMHSGLVLSNKPRVLLGVCGSVATVKVPEIACKLSKTCEIRIVTTNASKYFMDAAKEYNHSVYLEFKKLEKQAEIVVYCDDDEWSGYTNVGKDPVVHIELRKWADILLIAPLSANTLAKLSNGICDNLLTSIVRAWDFNKPICVAPAMNTYMWDHPFTEIQLEKLRSLRFHIIPPVSKVLACGDIGNGALATVDTLCAWVFQCDGPFLGNPAGVVLVEPSSKQVEQFFGKYLSENAYSVSDRKLHIQTSEFRNIRGFRDSLSLRIIGILCENDAGQQYIYPIELLKFVKEIGEVLDLSSVMYEQ